MDEEERVARDLCRRGPTGDFKNGEDPDAPTWWRYREQARAVIETRQRTIPPER